MPDALFAKCDRPDILDPGVLICDLMSIRV